MSAKEFLDRVMPHLPELKSETFSYRAWRFDKRPTSEGVGMVPGLDVDVDALAAHILDVESYPGNIKYVEATEIIDQVSEREFTYYQRMNLPVIGRMQVQIDMADHGERDGYRVIAWAQDNEGTAALPKKQGARTQYNLGAWLLRPDKVVFALSSAPLKSDIGTLKYLGLTAGADVAAGEVIRQNIRGMVDWANRD